MAVFDALHLTPHASLNRVRIVDLPGVDMETALRGKTAYDLLGAEQIAHQVRAHASELQLPDARERTALDLLPALSRCLMTDDERIRATALQVTCSVGRALGYVLLTLWRGDVVNRQARDDWDESYWSHWAGIRAVWLGGGIVSGPLGQALRDVAAEVVREQGMGERKIGLAAFPSVLPLIGAARSASAESQAALVFDFGHSLIKRAYALYQGGTLGLLRMLSPLPVPPIAHEQHGLPHSTPALDLAEDMVEVLVRTWEETGEVRVAGPSQVLVSLASYVRDGHPLPRQGGMYAQLHTLAPSLEAWLDSQMQKRTGTQLRVKLLHDGTAAARAYAGEDHTAVVMLGTALGVGFPPPAQSVRPLAADWALVKEEEWRHG